MHIRYAALYLFGFSGYRPFVGLHSWPLGGESMHWLLDVEFKDDLSRYRKGFGAKNMAIIRRFALNLVRANTSKGSVKTKRKSAGWDTRFLLEILQLRPR